VSDNEKCRDDGARACPQFPACSASLCPCDPDIAKRVWYPTEPVCSRKWGGKAPPWLEKQRRVARRCRAPGTYFTRAMLDSITIVGRAVRGLSPDIEDAAEAEEAWIAQKLRTAPSPEARARRVERARKLRESSSVVALPGAEAGKVSEAMGG